MGILRRLARLNKQMGLKNAPKGVQTAALVTQLAFAAIAALVLAFYLVRVLLSLSVPGDAVGILEEARTPASYVADIESVRINEILGQTTEGQSLRVVAVDSEANAFQARLFRIYPGVSEALLASDGSTSVLKFDQGATQKLERQIPAAAAAAPSPADILASSPSLVSEERTVRGAQAWEIAFTLTPAIVQKLFLSEVLDLQGEEQMLISEGRFSTDWAYVLVSRRDRSMVVLDTRFTLEGGATYRFLVKYRDFDRVDLSQEPVAS